VTLWNDLASAPVDGGFMVELGDFYAGQQRKLLLEIEIPAMAALGLAQVCELDLQWVELATMDTHKISIPVSVNVVPGDEAAGRIPNATVRTERAFQEAQRHKQAATDALRAGNAPAAAKMYASAAEALGGYADVEMQAEADVLFDLADRAQHDDASRTAKFSEADRHRKSRRRG
jgi:Ca-activated chloride channel homolog